MYINKIIIHDTIISVNIEQFVKKFLELITIKFIDMQLRYNQLILKKRVTILQSS